MSELIETWQIHNRVHLFLLEEITEEALESQLFPRGRTVRDLFAHIHNVRLMWLKSAAPELLENLEKLEKEAKPDKNSVQLALKASGAAIETLLENSKVKGFKPHATAFLGYLISHESHHRGQIEWALRHAGHTLTDKTSYGLWEWEVR
jgi:uncharacterized damage-inducible protein DinB